MNELTNEELIISALEAEMSEAGCECKRRSNALLLPSIALELFARDPKVQDAMGGMAVSVTFEARAEGATTDGIKVFQLGYGPTDFDAARDASYQWRLGVYPALVTFIARPEHRCDVDMTHMIVGDDETGDQFGWTVHLPPILSRAYGENPLPEHPEQNAVFMALFDSIHPYAAHSSVFWVECFAARYPDRKVDATCRLNNEDWFEGRNALLAWAMSWPDPRNSVLSRRQFVLFEPTQVNSIPEGSRLSKKLSNLISERQAARN
jgi:hypothetical protein